MSKRTFFAGPLLGGAFLFGWLALRQWEVRSWLPVAGEVVVEGTRTEVVPPLETKAGSVPPGSVHWTDYSYRVDGRE
jgi:hypothetical protein